MQHARNCIGASIEIKQILRKTGNSQTTERAQNRALYQGAEIVHDCIVYGIV
jgi:hypothetical protein